MSEGSKNGFYEFFNEDQENLNKVVNWILTNRMAVFDVFHPKINLSSIGNQTVLINIQNAH